MLDSNKRICYLFSCVFENFNRRNAQKRVNNILNNNISYLHSKEFNDKYYYDGELGAIYSKEKTLFRLWAPTAKQVELIDYNLNKEYPMQSLDRGIWELALYRNCELMQYNYRLHFADGKIETSTDPYSRSLTANSLRSVVVDLFKTNPQNWGETRMPSFSGAAIIYEVHIRDLTIGKNNGITNKGKFLGLTEENTRTTKGNLSGLDYLSNLGVTHVQLLPINDFGTVDECAELGYNAQYNWGYDPLNFNVPEGSYISDPGNPIKRISEPKQMIAAMHKKGLRVIMDVVYNHVYTTLDKLGSQYKSSLEKTVPGYYFRMKKDGSFYDGTGCGNEAASEQPMMRKYIIDSVCYWAKEYRIDGFRFDLMGILDIDTMHAVRAELDKIDPSIIILGEGWDMGTHPRGSEGANQRNIHKLPGIAVFNDWYRNTIKGGNSLNDKGFINGGNNIGFSWALLNNIKGMQHNEYYTYNSPLQSVVYNEAHDNFTLYDQLVRNGYFEEEIIKMHALALCTQYIANGIVFIHGGQEFLRSKKGDQNSYASPDSINEFDYDRVEDYLENYKLFKSLNEFRKKYNFVRLNNYNDINKSYTHDYLPGTIGINNLGYKVSKTIIDENKIEHDAYILINSGNKPLNAPLPKGDYKLIIDGMRVYDNTEMYYSEGYIEVPAMSLILLVDLGS